MGINNKALTTQIKEKENKFSFINPGDSNTLQQRNQISAMKGITKDCLSLQYERSM